MVIEHINDDIENLVNTIKELNDQNYMIIIDSIFGHGDPQRKLSSDDIFYKLNSLSRDDLQELSNMLGYGKLSEQAEYNDALLEVAPPDMEDWIKSNKERFIKEYGKKKGLNILYATAWKQHNEKLDDMIEEDDCSMMDEFKKFK